MRVSVSSIVKCVSLVLVLAFGGALPASAHPRMDPRQVRFTASADDSTVDDRGVPLVHHYALKIFIAGTNFPLQTVNLGKPTPNQHGNIRVEFLSLLRYPLLPDVPYEAVVEAVGPYGASESERSNPFWFSRPPCDPWISPVRMEVNAGGGSGGLVVNAASWCSWRAESDDPWITITGRASDSGDGTVTFRVAANTTRNARQGTLTVAGQTFKVNQDGNPKGGKNDKDDKGKDRDKAP